MFGCYSVINIVVLLNLLIAMMNHSYQLISVRKNSPFASIAFQHEKRRVNCVSVPKTCWKLKLTLENRFHSDSYIHLLLHPSFSQIIIHRR